jgi:DNA-binding transcriptional LysR family regulator
MLNKANSTLSDIKIVLHEMVTKKQIEALHSHEIDVSLLRATEDLRNVEVTLVLREPMMLAVPRGHPLATGKMPSLKDLAGESFITFNPIDGKYFYDMIDEHFRSEGVLPNYVQKISQVHTMLALVSARLGLAIVPQSAQVLRFEGTVLRKMKAKTFFAELFIAWRRDNPNSRTLHSLKQNRVEACSGTYWNRYQFCDRDLSLFIQWAGPILNATNPNLRPFKSRRGKLI